MSEVIILMYELLELNNFYLLFAVHEAFESMSQYLSDIPSDSLLHSLLVFSLLHLFILYLCNIV